MGGGGVLLNADSDHTVAVVFRLVVKKKIERFTHMPKMSVENLPSSLAKPVCIASKSRYDC